MQINLKTAVTAALTVGAALAGTAANAALITNLPTAAGGSDLILLVKDDSKGVYFTQDLGNQLDTIYSKAQVITDGILSTEGSFATPTTGVQGNDALLAAFLGGTHTGDTFEWVMMAADRTGTTTASGAQRALFTSTIDQSLAGTPPTNTNVGTMALNQKNFLTYLNGASGGYGSGNTSASFGYNDGSTISDGKNSPISWISASFGNGGLVGGPAQTMYLFATNGDASGNSANNYLGGTVSIDALGNITVTNVSAVPLPAAVWLLGSGLLGLVGIGRRRLAA